MSAASPGPDDVAAPPEALGWTARHGFITDADTLDAAIRDGMEVLNVDDGAVRDVEGNAPLATAIRQDRDVALLMAEVFYNVTWSRRPASIRHGSTLDALLDAMRAHIEWAATNGVVFTDGVVCG
jgi:hypothetical protein